MKKRNVAVLLACLLALAGCASTPAPGGEATAPAATAIPAGTSSFAAPPHLPHWRDLAYVPEAGASQRLDVYLPDAGQGPYPAVLAFHGGGFRARSKTEQGRLARPFTDMGWAFVPANYRLTPNASYPAQVEDIFCALAWIHANHEEHELDSGRLVVMGESAGGYLAAMLATVDDPASYLQDCPHELPASGWIQGAVILYGLYDFTSIDGYPDVETNLEPFWGAAHAEIPPERLAEMSPKSWVDGSEPPTLIIHGTSDTAVPSWMSEEFAETLEGAGVEVQLLLLDTGHAFTMQPLTSPANVAAFEAIESFLGKVAGR